MAKGLTPEAIEQAEFPTALRGYDKDEVEAYLRRVAAEHRRLLTQSEAPKPSSEKPYQRLGQDVGDLLQQAKDTADRMKQRAEEEAARLKEEAKKAVKEMRDKAKQDAQQIKQTADYEAREKLKDAERRLSGLKVTEDKARERLDELRTRFRQVLDQLEQLFGERTESAPGATASGSADAPEQVKADANGSAEQQPPASEGNVVIHIDAESEEAPVTTTS